MEETDRKAFRDAFLLVGIALDVEITKPRIDLYWTILKEYEWPTVEKALQLAVKSKWFKFPEPGELIELIEGSPQDI